MGHVELVPGAFKKKTSEQLHARFKTRVGIALNLCSRVDRLHNSELGALAERKSRVVGDLPAADAERKAFDEQMHTIEKQIQSVLFQIASHLAQNPFMVPEIIRGRDKITHLNSRKAKIEEVEST